MKKVLVFLADGFEEIEAITPVDVLRRAGCDVTMISVTGRNTVTSRRNVTVMADQLFSDSQFDQADMIILPGGQPGANNLNNHDGLKKLILNFNDKAKFLAAICAAPLVFGGLGILRGRNATCFPGTETQLTGAHYTGKPVEIDGHIITGKGPGVALQFSLKLAEILVGKEKSSEIRNAMLSD